jgi:hypothetical protein
MLVVSKGTTYYFQKPRINNPTQASAKRLGTLLPIPPLVFPGASVLSVELAEVPGSSAESPVALAILLSVELAYFPPSFSRPAVRVIGA